MSKKQKFLYIFLPFSLVLLCCLVCIIIVMITVAQGRGSGNVVSKDVQVSEFTKIKLNGRGNLIIKQDRDAPNALKIEAEDNIVDKIETEVKDGELIISYKRKLWWPFSNVILPKKDINFYVTVDDIAQIEINGAGELTSEYIETDKLKVEIDGAGKVKLNELNANDLEIKIFGSAELNLQGNVDNQSVEINGSGQYDASQLKSKKATINIKGDGDASVYTDQSLKIRINGAGKVEYKGDPEKIDKKISGVGEVKAL